jgi:hypothetical protein
MPMASPAESFKYYSAVIDTPFTDAYIFLWLQVPFGCLPHLSAIN